MDQRRRTTPRARLHTAFGIATSALLALAPTQEGWAQIGVGAPFECLLGDCDANTSDEGGDHHNVDLAQHLAEARAQGNGAANRTAFAEVGLRFRPCFTGPTTIRIEDIDIVGQLRGFGGGPVIRGEVEVRAILRDVTDDLELSNEVVFERVEEGTVGTTVIRNIERNEQAEIAANLVADHTYDAVVRVRARKFGLGGRSNFQTGDRGVSFNAIKVRPEFEDTDGDGLFDQWEISGIDVDCDGTVEVDLPAMGASPTVKDVFVELDWMTGSEPTQAALAAVVAAFDQAPPGAGGVITANQGIRLWFDTGNLTDPTASEDGAGPNTCSDGIDNSPGGAEGLADQSDPDCLVGALAFSTLQGGGGLGGGNGFAIGGIPSLDADSDDDGINDFQEAKFDPARGNFDPDRLLAFRYGISGVAGGAPPQFGGQARGNDFLLLGQSAGLLMHELGHTLGLGHGGPEDGNNCKPNYVSVMNYRYQGGITVAGGIGAGQDIDGDGAGDGMILDYSPPRFANGRGFAPLATLDETAWDETVVLDASDSSNFFAWADPSRQLVASLLNALPDWNNDGDTVDQAPPPIDFNTSFWNPAADEGGGAGSCGDGIDNNGDGNVDAADPVCNGNVRCGLPANASNTLHAGADDWSNLAFDPRRFADTDEGDIPAWLDEPTEEEIEFVAQALQTTDLVVSQKIADPDPVAAGQPIVYTTTVENRGPNPASQVVLVDHLPDELVFVEGEPSCTASGATVECALGYLAAGESREVRIVARVRLDLACAPDSQFVALGNSAEARNELGPDLEPGDNSTRVVSQGLCATYEYAAKFVCGTQGSPEDPRLARGRYATTVNVHNPHDEDVYFFKKLALTFPPERQEPGRVRPIGIDRLAYDEALKADCAEARDLIGEDGPGYVEGYLVVQSPRSLDVDAVYTAESQEREGAPPTISIDVEAVDERQRRRGPRPDLVVEPALPEPPFDERFGFQLPEGVPGALFCGDNGPQGGPARTVEAVVRNIGAGDAGPSELRLDFGDGSSASAPVGALPAGDSATVSADIPGSCYATGSCLFDLTADGAATVAETDETNNEASGLCLRPAG